MRIALTQFLQSTFGSISRRPKARRPPLQCFKYLKPGGRLRIAVPDANHPDPAYYEFVRPGGWGTAPDEHKILYTYQTLGDMLRSVGYQVDLLEYCDEKKAFPPHRVEPS